MSKTAQNAAAEPATTSEASTPTGDVTPAPTKKGGKTVTLTELIAVITRSEVCKISTQVYEHELPLLQRLHGEDFVSVSDSYEVEVEGFSVVQEYERLKRRYAQKGNKDPAANVVEVIYGIGAERLAQKLKLPVDGGASYKPAASMQEGDARRTKRTAT
jgi:hypothetical protein